MGLALGCHGTVEIRGGLRELSPRRARITRWAALTPGYTRIYYAASLEEQVVKSDHVTAALPPATSGLQTITRGNHGFLVSGFGPDVRGAIPRAAARLGRPAFSLNADPRPLTHGA